ncbi:hypothetical protein ASG25_15560 [Rhizobium sp. Leaf384]|uniref:hypothetical protein n=1 Tax=unclassified Rhizobium TaxID=2613769 RepID=UPI00071416EC|nr:MULTISPECIES: hypothetical protein [unclassified Rhizobium]KQS76835.1 hypothetical protein ASG25_15560 [Rhizobium sp. Leaf384]KQS78106.1 hypothetical protein ASG58_06775 [Rhizobium sp. Leaf383]
MVTLPNVMGTNHPSNRRVPCRLMLAGLLGVLFLALMGAVPLATVGMARHAASERAEARV